MTAIIKGLIAVLLVPLLVGTILTTKVEPVKAMTNEDLSELIVLGSLTNNWGFNDDLAGLIVLDSLTTGDVTNDLGELIVLDSLFGSNLGFNDFNDLAGLIVLDNLF